MSIAQFGIGNALRGLGRNLVENYLRNPANSYANARRLFRLARSSGPMGAHARAIVRAFWDEGWEGVRAYGRQLGEQAAPLLRQIEMTSMGAANAVSRVGTATVAITEESFVAAVATAAGVALGLYEVGSHRKGVHGSMLAGAESALADDVRTFLHPLRHPLRTLEDAFDPLHLIFGSRDHDDRPTKKHKPNPRVGSGGDFSGLVTTFRDPVTSRILGYKGISRKRKFHALERFSPFWKQHNRLTQTSVLAGPSQA